VSSLTDPGWPAAEPPNGAGWPPPPTPPNRREQLWTGLAALVAAVFALALGVPYGLLWARIAPKLPVVAVDGGRAAFGDAEPEQWVADEGWFVFLGLGFGVLAAFLVWWLGRRWRGPLLLGAVAVGAIGGGIVAWWIGHRIGLAGYQRALAAAHPGDRLLHPPALRIRELGWWRHVLPNVGGVLLVEAFAAAVTYTVLAGWSRYGTLRPGQQAEPAQFAPVAQEISWGSWAPPGHPAAPAPPAPGEAAPPRD
jgi:hypothetical protein